MVNQFGKPKRNLKIKKFEALILTPFLHKIANFNSVNQKNRKGINLKEKIYTSM